MWLTFLVSFIGFHIIFRMNRTFLHSIGTSEKKLSAQILFFSTFLSVLFHFFQFSPLQTWILVSILISLSPILSRGMRIYREKQLPVMCLNCLDQIILILKSGNSFRTALEQVELTETSWIRPFLAEIRRSLHHQTQIQSNSDWFQTWSREILDIEASKVKTIEQLEALRRQIRVEIKTQKQISQVMNGPKFQIVFMSLLFLSLNGFFLKNGLHQDLLLFLSISWLLFLTGLLTTFIILRTLKWKI